jgi:hypothetical protein
MQNGGCAICRKHRLVAEASNPPNGKAPYARSESLWVVSAKRRQEFTSHKLTELLLLAVEVIGAAVWNSLATTVAIDLAHERATE